MGLINDLKLRVRMARKYLLDETMRARDFIFNKGYTVGSAAVERLCKPQSIVPTMVCFKYYLVTGISPINLTVIECLCGKTRIDIQSFSNASR